MRYIAKWEKLRDMRASEYLASQQLDLDHLSQG
jgi:hypothetical protein